MQTSDSCLEIKHVYVQDYLERSQNHRIIETLYTPSWKEPTSTISAKNH